MSLPNEYLKYEKRGYGQDHDLYDWRMAANRPKLEWPNKTKVALSLIVPLEFFPLNPSGAPFKQPGAMQTAYPDLRHFTVRDYGNRIGAFRILAALAQSDVKATFAVNGEVARRYAPLMEALKEGGHEVAAHGLSTDHIHHEAMSESEEATLIEQTLSCFESKPSGWLSPARNQSTRTPNLLAAAGLSYCLDWEMDQVPTTMKTDNGPLTAIPLFNEISDFNLLHTRRQTEESWLTQIEASVELLVEEYETYGAQSLAIRITPYIMGQPFRIWALRALLTSLSSREDVWICPAGTLADTFTKGILK